MNWQVLDPSILGPALPAGLLVSATHVPLGRRVLARGIIFLDLAVAQMAGLGLIAAHTFDWQPGDWQQQAVAFAAAAAGCVLLSLTERRWPQLQEALIGSLFVLASSSGILLLASNPHAGEHLRELLVGQILWVSYGQLLPVGLLHGAILGLWFGIARHGASLWFYLLFALTITASVQLVGVYLVFASLILPALAVHGLPRKAHLWGYGIAACSYILGLGLAALWDLPAGGVIVFTLAVCAMAGNRLIKLQAHFSG